MNWKLFIAGLIVLSSCKFKSEKADLILHNAKIYTLNQNNDIFRACAVKDGKIIDIGAENHILSKYSSESIVDLQHKIVFPGFIDAHCHFLGLGESLLKADLVGTSSFDEVLERLEKFESRLSHDWILGRGWDQNDWTDQSFPSNEKLNEMFPDRPVFIVRIDGHAALVNDTALELAGITCYTEVTGGNIMKENQSCTGVLVDNAMDIVSELIPEFTRNDKILALKLAEKKCLKAGLTTLDDAGLNYKDILLIDSLHKTGDLKMHIYAMFSDSQDNYDFIETSGPIVTDRLQANSFKFYADGALGSRGACLKDPYADQPEESGFLLKDASYFENKAEWIKNNNLQMNTHCIGDSANKVLLDIYAKTLNEPNDRRWRIEHCQVVDKADLQKFQDFNIVPSVQPLHATSDFPWFKERLGQDRINRAYSNQELLGMSGLVALGTDFPVETYDPLQTFYAAVFRKKMNGKPLRGIQPENALSRMQALQGMTLWAALSNFQEKDKGTIEIGKNADFTIVSNDILNAEERTIPSTKVYMTYILGECVYKAR